MVTRLWWLRHGPTHEKTFLGWRDVAADLSDTAKLDRLRATLPKPAILVSSDLLRAQQTADAVSHGHTRLPDRPDLREFNFGAWDGMPFDAVAERDPELSRAFWDAPGTVAAPDGESWNGVAARVQDAVASLITEHSGKDIILVAHFGVILTQIATCRGETKASALARKVVPLSITRIDHGPDGRTLIGVNHSP